MTFASPIWLLGLVPWAGIVLWLLWGRRRREDVPFLELWKGPVQSPAPKRALQAPPLWVSAALAAMLLGILGSAHPFLRLGASAGPSISIIVDRGASMSARGSKELRFRELAEAAGKSIAEQFGQGAVDLVIVPGQDVRHSDRAGWAKLVKDLAPTAVNTDAALQAAIGERLGATDGPIMVLTDRDIKIDSSRVAMIHPQAGISNVGIVALAARQRPAGQVMVRVRNDSAESRAPLGLLVDGREEWRDDVQLPSRGGEKDYFIDLKSVGKIIEAVLDVHDDLPADDHAYLVSHRAWPVVEAKSALPAEVSRMIESYRRLYPPGPESRHIAVVSSADALAMDEAGVIVLAGASAPSTQPAGQVQRSEHPLTAAVSSFPSAPPAAEPPVAGGWTTIISIEGKTLVAIRESPVRQVWIGFNDEKWATSPSFVVFWTNVFNWVGQGVEAFDSQPAAQLAGQWSLVRGDGNRAEPGLWPGVWRDGQGTLRAVNAGRIEAPSAPGGDWHESLRDLAARHFPNRSGTAISSVLIILALAAMLLAAATWRRGPSLPNPSV